MLIRVCIALDDVVFMLDSMARILLYMCATTMDIFEMLSIIDWEIDWAISDACMNLYIAWIENGEDGIDYWVGWGYYINAIENWYHVGVATIELLRVIGGGRVGRCIHDM